MTLWRNRGSFWLLNLFIIEIEWHFVWWMYHTYSQMSCFVTGIYLFKEYSGFVTWISSCGTVECTVSIYGTSGFVAWIYPFKKLSGLSIMKQNYFLMFWKWPLTLESLISEEDIHFVLLFSFLLNITTNQLHWQQQ
jgi:hypothetical protein